MTRRQLLEDLDRPVLKPLPAEPYVFAESVLYQRIPKLLADLALARGDGRYARLLRALGGVQLLILDDWGLEPSCMGRMPSAFAFAEAPV